MIKYWLMKSEPDCFSIDDLKRVKREPWDGIRNYQARNFIRDDMEEGDISLFYHSNCKVPAVVGICKICSDVYPDPTQFDPAEDHFDPKSSQDNPRWLLRDVEFVEKFPSEVSLKTLRETPELAEMLILRRGNRLSITPINKKHFDKICAIART